MDSTIKSTSNKLVTKILVIIVLSSCFALLGNAQQGDKKPDREWWNDNQWKMPVENPKAKMLPLIMVKGNKFVNSKGDTILFRGLSISDPDKLADQGHWNKDYFVKVKDMGAQLIRIPIHPIAWRERTPEKYLELLDQAVEWCTDMGMYIIIDWHSIGNLQMELFQDQMYNTSKKETYEFWRMIAGHFMGNNTVAFYELFNEPTNFFGLLGSATWEEWKKINEDIIDLIRAYDKETIPLVAGFDWAYDLTILHYNPIKRDNIGYTTHPYAHKRSQPWPPKWEEDFGFAADQYPIIATEFGFGLKEGEIIDEKHYANIITSYLESKGISWMAWVFDPDWGPSMFESWETYKLTGCGEYFKNAMHKPLK
jgi:endoglucanase